MSFRKRFQFWLDFGKAEHIQLAEIIADLKSKRLYASTVRDGIRLINSLRQGDVSVLLELFPDVESKLCTSEQPQNAALADAISKLALVMQQQPMKAVGGMQPMKAASVGFGNSQHSTKVASIDMSAYDDDDLSAVAVKQSDSSASAEQASSNFLNSLMSLQS